MKVDAVKKTDE
jgi:hypothetical protein